MQHVAVQAFKIGLTIPGLSDRLIYVTSRVPHTVFAMYTVIHLP